MLKVALTGGIASGKSELITAVRDIPGVETVQADDLAKEIYEPNNPRFEEVVRLFGDDVKTPGGEIDLAEVRKRIFENGELRRELEGIAHPYVRERLQNIAEEKESEGAKLLLVEIPLLFQTNDVNADEFDYIVLVDAKEEKQINRLTRRDGISEEEARKRVSLQKLPSTAGDVADFLIDANDTRKETRRQGKELISKLLS